MNKLKNIFGNSKKLTYSRTDNSDRLENFFCDDEKNCNDENINLCDFEYEEENFTTRDYINFLNNVQLTEKNKSYNDIINYTYDDIESDCRFIQWIFPLAEKSAFALNVPIIDLEELNYEIEKDKTIVKKIAKSYILMMNHWGLLENNSEKIELLNGHNALRFSRMLQSLVYHGQIDLAWEAYRLISQHFGNSDENLNILEPKIMSFDGQCVDAWKYHLLKALREIKKI